MSLFGNNKKGGAVMLVIGGRDDAQGGVLNGNRLVGVPAPAQETVAEFETGIMLLKATAVQREIRYVPNCECCKGRFRRDVAYLRAGNTPAWDYVEICGDEKKFFKKQEALEVDREGNPIMMNTASFAPATPTTDHLPVQLSRHKKVAVKKRK